MRLKKNITSFEAFNATVVAPKYNSGWSNHVTRLREILDANLNYTIASTLEWSEWEQEFSVIVRASTVIAGKICGVKATFVFDHTNLFDEVERLQRETTDFRQAAESARYRHEAAIEKAEDEAEAKAKSC